MSAQRTDKRRHYLPAGSIGHFSSDDRTGRLRERKVWVLRKEDNRLRLDKAENVGYGKMIYGYGKGRLFDHDTYFKDAEPMVHEPVDRLMADPMPWVDANDWTKLAWYITIQIARNPDGEYKLKDWAQENDWNPAHLSVGYPLNAQRISTAVIRARWDFLWSRDRDFILGDRGITGIAYPRWESWAYFVPLRRNFGVMLGPAPYEKQLKWSDGAWCDLQSFMAPLLRR